MGGDTLMTLKVQSHAVEQEYGPFIFPGVTVTSDNMPFMFYVDVALDLISIGGDTGDFDTDGSIPITVHRPNAGPGYPGFAMGRGTPLAYSRWIGIGSTDNRVGNYLTSNVYFDGSWNLDITGSAGSIFSIHEGSTTAFDFRHVAAGANPRSTLKLLTIYNDAGGIVLNEEGADRDFRIESENVDTIFMVDADLDNLSFLAAGSFGNGVKVIFIGNAGTVPNADPVGGGILYAEGGALKYRGSGATVTTIAPA